MDYLDWKASYVRNTSTPRAYKVWVDRFHNHVQKPVTEVTLEDVSKFRSLVREQYAPANVQYGMSILHDYLKFQMAQGLNFPIAMFKVKRERANSHYVLKEKEYQKMLGSIVITSPQAVRDQVILRVLWETGMRVGELVHIQRSDVFRRGCQIYNEKNTYRRNVYWSAETEDLLRFYLKLRTKDKIPELFISRAQKSLSSRQVERIVKDVARKNRLNKGIVPHSFRHAFVHRQILKGVSEPVVANMVGHASTNTIMTYSKLSSRELLCAWGQI